MSDSERTHWHEKEIGALQVINRDQAKRIATAQALLAQAIGQYPQSQKLRQAWDALRNGPSLSEHRGRT